MVTGSRIYIMCVSVYVTRRYDGGGVWLFVRGPTGMEVVVMGGHMIDGLSKRVIAPPQGWPRGPVSRWWWVAVPKYECDHSLGFCKNIFS